MDVAVRVPAALRDLIAGQRAIVVAVAGDAGGGGGAGGETRADGETRDVGEAGAGVTVASVLDALAATHPALERRVRDERGQLRTHVNVFVGPDNIRDLDGLRSAVPPGREVSIIPAVSGG